MPRKTGRKTMATTVVTLASMRPRPDAAENADERAITASRMALQ